MAAGRLIAAMAFLASAAAYLVMVVIGVSLATVQQLGARGPGVVLTIAATLAFAAAMFVVFASPVQFRAGPRRVGLVLATVVAMLPPGVLAVAAFAFSGFPVRSAMPALDWGMFGFGAAMSLGAAALAIHSWNRMATRSAPPADQDGEAVGARAGPQSGLI